MSDELSAAAAVGSEVLGAVVSSASARGGVGAAVTAETRVGVEGTVESSASVRDAVCAAVIDVGGTVESSASVHGAAGATEIEVEGTIESSASVRGAACAAGVEEVERAHWSQHIEVSQLVAAVWGARVRGAERTVSGTGVWVRDKLHAAAAMESEALGAIESSAGARDGDAAAAASET